MYLLAYRTKIPHQAAIVFGRKGGTGVLVQCGWNVLNKDYQKWKLWIKELILCMGSFFSFSFSFRTELGVKKGGAEWGSISELHANCLQVWVIG